LFDAPTRYDNLFYLFIISYHFFVICILSLSWVRIILSKVTTKIFILPSPPTPLSLHRLFSMLLYLFLHNSSTPFILCVTYTILIHRCNPFFLNMLNSRFSLFFGYLNIFFFWLQDVNMCSIKKKILSLFFINCITYAGGSFN